MALPDKAGKLTSLVDIRNYILAGDARFTLVSNKSNERKTFRVREAGTKEQLLAPPTAWYVDLLVGSDNGRDYKYLAFLFTKTTGPEQLRGLDVRQNKERWGNESFEAFGWLVRQLNGLQGATNDDLDVLDHRFNQLAEVYHLGTCGKCGRDLTTPESVARGLGPVCAGES